VAGLRSLEVKHNENSYSFTVHLLQENTADIYKFFGETKLLLSGMLSWVVTNNKKVFG
jgi:hypothetical protein